MNQLETLLADGGAPTRVSLHGITAREQYTVAQLERLAELPSHLHGLSVASNAASEIERHLSSAWTRSDPCAGIVSYTRRGR